jgi:hypothetical protein
MGYVIGTVLTIGSIWFFFWLLFKLQKKVNQINKRLPGRKWEWSGGNKNAARYAAEMGEKAADAADAAANQNQNFGPH